jgi:tetratricopeptide (TPR) repeat protein
MLNAAKRSEAALDNLKQGNYTEAIAILERIEQFSFNLKTEDLLQIKKSLADAYYGNGQTDKAIFIYRQLANSNNVETQAWAESKLQEVIMSKPEIKLEQNNKILSNKNSSTASTDEISDNQTINTKNLAAFKDYYQNHLLSDLKEFEKRRKIALKNIIVSTLLTLLIILGLVKGFLVFSGIQNCSSQNYIAIAYDYNLFEPKLFESMLSFKPLKEYFENFQLMIGVVEDLKLNRSIWSKN